MTIKKDFDSDDITLSTTYCAKNSNLKTFSKYVKVQ